jgi:hypothetical protein
VATLSDYIRAHLINAAVVRDPRTAGPLPPLWRDPENGAPGPGDFDAPLKGMDAVVSIFMTGGFPTRLFGHSRRLQVVDFWFRTLKAWKADELYLEIRRLLVRADDPMDWMLGGDPPGGTRVIMSTETRPLQQLAAPGETTAGYTYISQIGFETYVTP